MFRVGMKVVCIDDGSDFRGIRSSAPNSFRPYDFAIKLGEIYIVRWVGEHSVLGIDYTGIRLAGIVRNDGYDTPFHSARFRPLVERKTDISIFNEILRKVTRKDRVSA